MNVHGHFHSHDQALALQTMPGLHASIIQSAFYKNILSSVSNAVYVLLDISSFFVYGGSRIFVFFLTKTPVSMFFMFYLKFHMLFLIVFFYQNQVP